MLPIGLGYRWLRRQHPVLLGGLLLAVVYTMRYLGYPALPGHNPQYPMGWWGWWDQSNYLASATAFAHLDLTPARHLYPLGYGLLGAPFVRLMPMHPFYAIDLMALLLAMVSFARFARRCGCATRWGVLLFVLATAADPVLFEQWVVPWNTAPAAAAIWLLLALAAAHIDGERRPILLGLVAVSIPMLRPTELLLTLPPLAACLGSDLRHGRLRYRDVARFGLAVLAGALLYLGLHCLIYGPRPSPYMLLSANIGFTLHHFGWKAYVILVDPRAWIGGGAGLLRRCPWLIPGIAGLAPAMLHPKTAMLAIALLLHSILYISYVDLLPTGLWRYLNVHYWSWAFPGFALLGVLLVRTLLTRNRPLGAGFALSVIARSRLAMKQSRVGALTFGLLPVDCPGNDGADWPKDGQPRARHEVNTGGVGREPARRLAIAGVAAVSLLLCLRFDPVPAQPGQSIDALDFPSAPAAFGAVYFGALTVNDAAGSLANIAEVRALPGPAGGIRVLSLTRALQPPIALHGQTLDALAPVALHARLGFGIPFWPWKAADEFYGPR